MVTQTEGIAALLLNVLVLPGLGTVIWGDRTHGIWQIVLAVIGFVLFIFLIGIPILIGTWIWALVSGIKILQGAEPSN